MPAIVEYSVGTLPKVSKVSPVATSLAGRLTTVDRLYSSFSEPDAGQNELPTIAECATHLELLAVFAHVKEELKKLARSVNVAPEDVWFLYRKMAVSRFEKFIANIQKLDREDIQFPPVDIMMVWHAFMLHPRAYAQFDEKARVLGLKGLNWAWIHARLDRSRSATSWHAGPGMPETTLLHNLQDLLMSGRAEDIFSEAMPTHDFIYTDASGQVVFQYDLVAAVDRQSEFSTKMAQFSWHSSPSVESTLLRAIDRYEKFFAIIGTHPKSIIVPTLDVDLVWHTHQLSPAKYRAYSEKTTGGRFVDHNDELEAEQLGHSFANIRGLFHQTFAEEYHVCLCWTCEGSRAQGLPHLPHISTEDISAALKEEASRRDQMSVNIPLNLAAPQCADCGKHPLTCCPRVAKDGAAECGSNCGGDCGSGGCGNCGT